MPGRLVHTSLEGHYYPGDEFPFTYETTDLIPLSKKTDGWLASLPPSRKPVQRSCTGIPAQSRGRDETRWSSAIRWRRKTRRFLTTCGSTISPARSTAQRTKPAARHLPATQQPALLPGGATRPDRCACSTWVTQRRAAPGEPLPANFRRNPRAAPAAERAGIPQSFPASATRAKPNDLSLNDGTAQPPTSRERLKTYPVLVPKVDKDGNDIAGIRAVATASAARHSRRLESPRQRVYRRRALLPERYVRALRQNQGRAGKDSATRAYRSKNATKIRPTMCSRSAARRER